MEALNYTQLASVVLALSVAFGLLLIICLGLIWRTIQIQNDFMKEDEAVYVEVYNVENKIKEVEKKTEQNFSKVDNGYEKLCKDFNEAVQKLRDELVVPKYDNGDKIVCADGTKGVIQRTQRENQQFYYSIKTRKYFNHPAGEKRVSEFEILGRV